MADVTERIEKQMEGTNLALAAVAEVLQKMDSRLSKEEAVVEASDYANAQALAKADLVNSIAQEVISVLKEDMAGLDVSGGARKAKAAGGTPQNADDSESAVEAPQGIEGQQNTIQASLTKEEDEDEDTDMDKGADYKEDDDNADDEAANLPETKDAGEEEDGEETDEIKTMRKQIATLTKRLESTQGDMQKSITNEAESRLRKMGFREENGLKAPQITNGLGLDNTPLVKSSDDNDVAGQLSELSYKQLRDMQYKIESGETDGLPRELLG